MDTAGVIRTVLTVDIAAMALLAVIYLRRRRMSLADYCLWGCIALLLPVFGPFLVIANRPGELHPDPFPSSCLRMRVRHKMRMMVQEMRLYHPPLDVQKAPPHRRHPRRWL